MTVYTFIVNPVAGRGAGAAAILSLERLAQQSGLEYMIRASQSPGHAIALARDLASRADVIVAVGGDGTANEVLNGLMQAREAGVSETTLAVIGVGRGNDFAFGLGVQAGLESGFRALRQGKRSRLDVGRVVGGLYPQGRYFGNGVGVGFDAVVGFEALKIKRLSGFPNYAAAALKAILSYARAPLLEIEMDGETLRQPTLMVSVMNGKRLGGGFLMAPQGRVDDGYFDVCIAGQVSQIGILGLIPRFVRGTQASHPAIRTRQACCLRVRAVKGVLPAHADGETLCTAGSELMVELLPAALSVISLNSGDLP